ncbi:calcium/sodium antiporter [Gelidibacter salicanalis]|uniref:Calcium/sodium antiporter n=1 Tax=Gelidibacter salicanalis TaxID=291193 RepID=A0A934KU52_9FLAO|nr:calcium/sodium antiporter [Gelidibacter salicanalis]MBJ7880722.1 calcium/sodium antiporter [Gelidibacter salicanalis]
MVITITLFVLGFALLIKGADILVKGASSIAKTFGWSDLVIGLTIVSFGTSMPELIVNIMASIEGSAGIAVGNILGSNISNILLIIGISAIIYPLPLKNSTVFSEIPFSIAAILLVGFLVNSELPFDTVKHELSFWDGILLLFFFLLFMAYIFKLSKEKDITISTDDIIRYSTNKSILYIVLGCLGLFFGGKWIVDGAIVFAKMYGLSESFIGLTIVAVGTSLPELATSAVAAYRKNTDIAIGNVVGSNIFNLLWILGISSLIKPLPFAAENNTDILTVLLASSFLIIALVIGKKNHIDRWNGMFFIITYAMYITYLIIKQ